MLHTYIMVNLEMSERQKVHLAGFCNLSRVFTQAKYHLQCSNVGHDNFTVLRG